MVLHRRKRLDFHSNGMRFAALDAAGSELTARTYYSVGGGFVLGEDEAGRPAIVADPTPVPYPFASGAELLAITERHGAADQRRHAGQRAGPPGQGRGRGRACCGSGR